MCLRKQYIANAKHENAICKYFNAEKIVYTVSYELALFFQPVHNESGHYNTELFTEAAEKIIAGHNSSTPLFLYIAHHAVHSGNFQEPLQAPQRLVDVRKLRLVWFLMTN